MFVDTLIVVRRRKLFSILSLIVISDLQEYGSGPGGGGGMVADLLPKQSNVNGPLSAVPRTSSEILCDAQLIVNCLGVFVVTLFVSQFY
jgi:hypothetical protein